MQPRQRPRVHVVIVFMRDKTEMDALNLFRRYGRRKCAPPIAAVQIARYIRVHVNGDPVPFYNHAFLAEIPDGQGSVWGFRPGNLMDQCGAFSLVFCHLVGVLLDL
ncbi:hypothetical protein D3C76_1368920 [compost metagenome]